MECMGDGRRRRKKIGMRMCCVEEVVVGGALLHDGAGIILASVPPVEVNKHNIALNHFGMTERWMEGCQLLLLQAPPPIGLLFTHKMGC
jgi:hypothetical protein